MWGNVYLFFIGYCESMLSNANKSGTTARDASNAASLKRLGSRSMMSYRYPRMIIADTAGMILYHTH